MKSIAHIVESKQQSIINKIYLFINNIAVEDIIYERLCNNLKYLNNKPYIVDIA